jgi:hypothetical protein
MIPIAETSSNETCESRMAERTAIAVGGRFGDEASHRPPIELAKKFDVVRGILARDASVGASLLDVGCRGCELAPYVRDLAEYEGADLTQNQFGTVRHVLNVEAGLPMADQHFDYVVALDLVEHLDGFFAGLEELLRVSRRALIVALPNMGHLLFRARFLLTGRLGGKYDLTYGMGHDRHRWVTVLDQADTAMRQFAEDRNLHLETHWVVDSPKKRILAQVGRACGVDPAWWVWTSLYVLRRRSA